MESNEWEAGPLNCVIWRGEDPSVLYGGVRRRSEALLTVQILARYGDTRLAELLDHAAIRLRRPPGVWNIAPEPIVDVVVAPCPGQLPNNAPWRPSNPVPLADDLSVVPVSDALRQLVEEACDPPGVNAMYAIDLRGRPIYALLRDPAPREPVSTWDSDGRLQMCIALSRLVRPTSLAFGYAARITGEILGEAVEVRPGAVRGFGATAWTSDPARDWLDAKDFEALKDLIASFDASPFVPVSRVGRAFWYHEYAARTQLLDIRWPLLATAVETLIGTTGDRSTQQFIHRLPLLAERVGAPNLSKKDSRRLWGRRSGIIHGQRHGGLDTEDEGLYRRMEEIVRLALRLAVGDLAFRTIFEDDASIDKAFSLAPAQPKLVRCPACTHEFNPGI